MIMNMKLLNAKKYTALAICTAAIILAKTSSSMCLFFIAKEPKMPGSLYKID